MVFATAITLVAATLHATWNLVLKTAPETDRDLVSWGLFLVAAAFALPVVVVTGGPGMVALPWLAITAVVHAAYAWFLVAAYRHGDFSLAYPLARGGGALVSAVGGWLLLGDHLSWRSWAAIAVVAGGLVSLIGPHVPAVAVRDALLTGLTIGTYTLIDSHGARISADGVSYGVASLVAAAVGTSILFAAGGRTAALVAAVPLLWRRWLLAGACAVVAYTLVLVAVRHAPVGYVSVLREFSVVLGALVGWLVLKEALGRRRLVSALVIMSGMVGLIVTTI
ncbi:MAG: EamA family transporter [Acidimicrobiales bacterium]|nr:EamA family transporter [Acidimicrobiales bacterium]